MTAPCADVTTFGRSVEVIDLSHHSSEPVNNQSRVCALFLTYWQWSSVKTNKLHQILQLVNQLLQHKIGFQCSSQMTVK